MSKADLLFVGFADLPQKAKNLLAALEIAILEVEIEQERIKEGLERLALPANFSHVTDRYQVERQLEEELVYEKLRADIHLWLVAWENINKLLRSLRRIVNDARLDWIQDRRKRWFLTLNNARNSLEHIDERTLNATGKFSPLDEVYLEYSRRIRFAVFGIKINFDDSSFKKIVNLKSDLKRWYSKLPTVFDKWEKKYGWTIK